MKHLTQLTLTALAAISLTACGGSGEMDHSKMDDSKICLLYTSDAADE